MFTPPVRVALVTGAGSGMGRASARSLARSGREVFLADINLEAVQTVAEEIEAGGGRATAAQADVADPEGVAGLFDMIGRRTPRLDMLVHTAGILGETAFIEDIDAKAWRRMMAVNLDGAFLCARAAVRWMKACGGGRILLFSSVAALTPTPGALAYSAAKGAVNMMGRTLAAEVARHNIRVNVVAPGYVETPMLDGLPSGFARHVRQKTPLKRLGRVEEVAGLVEFLASPEADFFTGQIFSPNGGLVI